MLVLAFVVVTKADVMIEAKASINTKYLIFFVSLSSDFFVIGLPSDIGLCIKY